MDEHALELLREAFFLRQNGEYAPGGNENWRDWEKKTEAHLQGLLDQHQGRATAKEDYPVGGSQEAIAQWCGFASVADMKAADTRYAAEMTADAIADDLADFEAENTSK